MPQRFHDLAGGGQLVIWAIRHWCSARAFGRDVPTCVWQSFAVAKLPDAYAALCTTMTLLSFSASKRLKFAPPCCCSLTDAEKALISMLHALQQFEHERALFIAAKISLHPGCEEILAAALSVTRLLAKQGHRIVPRKARKSTAEAELLLRPDDSGVTSSRLH